MFATGSDRDPIVSYAREIATEMSQLCADLVRVPSVNGRDPEAGVVAILERYAAKYGMPSEVLEAAPGRPTIVIGPSAQSDRIAEGGLMLVGHTDTVPEGDRTDWKYDPFGAHVEGARLYGRGACDNKGGIAAAFFALVVLQRLNLLDTTNAALLCVPDEEAGATGSLGIVPLLQAHRLHGRGAIYTYPGLGVIQTGHRGVLRLIARADGESIHSGSRAWQNRKRGANAVLGIADLLLELEQLDINAGLEPMDSAWGDLRGVITPGTTINGGTGISIVPEHCEATIDIRLVPGQEHAAIVEQIRKIVDAIGSRRNGIALHVEVSTYAPPTSIPHTSAIVCALQDACSSMLSTQPDLEIAGPANEGYLLNEGGIPTICGFGPTGNSFHAPNEYVELSALPVASALYARTAVLLRSNE